jgi:hypothetical protein
MQIKHTFLFTLILGLAWTGLLFAYSGGPDPASNGIFGQPACNMAGCHVGNPLNAAGGSLTVNGLPAEYVPDQVYPITVVVQRTGLPSTAKYGFQMSAVDVNGAQAGSFTATSNRVSVISGNSIQFAQHNAIATVIAPFTGIFTFNWRAPASAAAGTVRFNVAGNAANGTGQNDGDFIYTRFIDIPANAPPPDLTFRTYTTANLGGTSLRTDGAGSLIDIGYSRIQPDAGSTTPSGVLIFGLRTNNVLVTEAGVPASSLITAGRIYAEVGGPVNTGLAIANPNAGNAVINFNFTNAAGVDFGGNSFVLGPGVQLAKFLSESPFSDGASVQGSFSFTSTVPISVIALRGFTNERGEFLTTTLPVLDLSAPTNTDVTYMPHFADGTGWKTQVVLVNPTGNPISGGVQFFSAGTPTAPGVPISINVNGTAGTSFPYTIPAKSSVKLLTSGTSVPIATGSVRVTPGQGSVAPSSLVVFTFKPGAFTVSEAGVAGVPANASRMYVEVSGSGTAPGTVQTGLAITNISATAATINLELFRLDGSSTGLSTPINLPGNGQVARFVHELFPGLALPFQGVIRISGGGVSVVGLRGRYNERGDFLITTTPASDEGAAPINTELLFPHLVNGFGWSTQFILFSGTGGQTTAGTLRFYTQDGAGLNLTLN